MIVIANDSTTVPIGAADAEYEHHQRLRGAHSQLDDLLDHGRAVLGLNNISKLEHDHMPVNFREPARARHVAEGRAEACVRCAANVGYFKHGDAPN